MMKKFKKMKKMGR